MQHPEITLTERFGSLWEKEKPKFVGRCAFSSCRYDIYDDYEYMTDYKGNVFGSRDCADAFYGLKTIGN